MLYKDTEIVRATVDQQIRQVLEPEMDAPANSYREVQLLVPLEPPLFVSLVSEADLRMGMNRTYKMPLIPSGAQITLRLKPNQAIWAAAKEQMSHLTLTIEYLTGDPS